MWWSKISGDIGFGLTGYYIKYFQFLFHGYKTKYYNLECKRNNMSKYTKIINIKALS